MLTRRRGTITRTRPLPPFINLSHTVSRNMFRFCIFLPLYLIHTLILCQYIYATIRCRHTFVNIRSILMKTHAYSYSTYLVFDLLIAGSHIPDINSNIQRYECFQFSPKRIEFQVVQVSTLVKYIFTYMYLGQQLFERNYKVGSTVQSVNPKQFLSLETTF